MKEALFILLVVCILAALTAVRYRKHISGFIGFARTLKDLKNQAGPTRTLHTEKGNVQLVNCQKCGVWVPQDKAIIQTGQTYCSIECFNKRDLIPQN